MKNTLIVLLLSFTIYGASGAEKPAAETARDELSARVQEPKEKIGMSEEQAAKIKEILEKRFEALKALAGRRERASGFREKRKLLAEYRSITKDSDKEIAKVLDDKQYKEFKKIQAGWQKEMRDGIKGRRGN